MVVLRFAKLLGELGIIIAMAHQVLADKDEVTLGDCTKQLDALVGIKDKKCTVPGLVGIKGQCSMYKECGKNLRLGLTTTFCEPSNHFNLEERKCMNVTEIQDCLQSICFPEVNDSSQSPGPIYKSEWNLRAENETDVSSISSTSVPFLNAIFAYILSVSMQWFDLF